jgi:hypothetical protein
MKKITSPKYFRWQDLVASKINFTALCFFVLFIGQSMNGQTVLINPNAEGGFENGTTFTDNGWSTVSASLNTWNVGTAPGWFTGTAGAYVSNDSGTTWAYGNTANRSSFYRDIVFPSGATSVNLSFDWRANGNDGNYDNLLVYVMDTSITPTTAGPTTTNTTTTGWTGYTNGTTGYYLLQRNGTSVPSATTNVTYTFTAAQMAYVAGSTKRLVFVWKNDGTGGANPPASVDNISLTAVVPTCFPATALQVSSFTLSTANLNWTAPASVPSQGYEYELRTNGAAGSGAAGLVTSGTLATGDVSAALNGLSANTSYSYYIRANCGGGDFSTWTGVNFFTGYCVPSSTSASSYINNFSTTGGSANISNLTSGYTATGYQDNYDTMSVSQYATGTVTFSSVIVGGTVGTSIWIDWNNDLVFDNATERVFVTAAYGGNQTGSFVVPASAALGDYRMRIRIDYNAIAPDACASTNLRTEAEDYKFTVIAAPACLAPSGVTATANTAFTATLNWTASVSTPTNGYQYYVSDDSTPPTAASTASGSAGAGITTALVSTGLAPTTTYYVWVRSDCGSGVLSDWILSAATFTTPCNPPLITGTTPASVCGQGTVTLGAASPTGNLSWFAAATGGTVLGTGTTFTTPVITADTSYWVEATTAGGTVSVGPASPTAQGGTTGNQTVAWNVNFTVLENTKLASVDIFPLTSGQTGAIVVRTSTGTVIATYPFTTTVSGGTTAQTVVLDHIFIPGNYQLYPTLPTAGLTRNTTGAIYPYTSSVATITGNGYDATYYMGFYNWQFSSGCTSARTEVVATVTTAPTFALSTNNTTAICSGQTTAAVTVVTGAGDYDTYVWSPSTGVTGNAVSGWVFNPSTTTTYLLTASQSAATLCQTSAAVVVTVNPNPVVNALTANATICEGTSATLNASTDGTAAIGTATTLTTATTQPTAFCNRWDQYWNQTIFTAAELQAAGLKAGNITSIAYTITTLGSGTNVTNFSISIGTTANTTMTSFETTGLSTVYGPSTYAHVIGVNTITFDAAYIWDGISNIIVDIRQDGADSSNNAITYYTATADNMTISATTSTDSAVTTLQDLVTAGTAVPATSLNRLNVVFGGQVDNGNIDWTWNPGALTGNSVVVSPTGATTYTLRGTNPTTGCYNETTLDVNVTSTPPPTGNGTQTFTVSNTADATIAHLVVSGSDVVWYASAVDALANVNPLATTTELVNGTIYYAVQTVDGCRSISALPVTVSVTLGNNSFDLAGLKYYPNPVTNVLNVEYTGNITLIEVYNTIGQRIVSKSVNEISTTIDMAHLAAGTYFVKVLAEGGSRTIKVMKN